MTPEPITIDGRTGTAVYLDTSWKPVLAAQADLCRVLFDDGGSAFYTVRPVAPQTVDGPALRSAFNIHHDAQGRFAPSNGTLAAELQSVESRLRGQPVEYAHAFDKNGTMVAALSNERDDHVVIPDTLDLKDTIFTHNHPSNGAFSPDDLTVASHYNVAEIRAVTATGVFRMERVGDKWPRGLAMEAEMQSVGVRDIFGPKVKAGTMPTHIANLLHWHTVWNRVVKLPKFAGTVKFSFEPTS